MAGSIWTACSRMALRNVQDRVVHVPWMRKAKGRETVRLHQRVVTDRGLVTTEWKSLWGGGPLWQQTEGTGPSSCAGQATAGTSQSRGDARSVPSHLGERGASAGDGHETSSVLDRKVTKRGPDFVALSNQESRRCKRCRRHRRISSMRSRRRCKPRQTWTCSCRKPRCQ